MRRHPLHRALLLAPLAAMHACAASPLEDPQVVISQQTTIRIGQAQPTKIDLLFMIDNSNTMEAMASELRNRSGQLFSVFRKLADNGVHVDLHVGVVTSDYGAGATGAPGCALSPGGDRGRLQALGRSASTNCKPPVGAPYIQYEFAPNGDQHNLPSGQDLAQTFNCMASVGSSGCGFEHPLESVYAALHDNLPENAGFLRDDALLAVVFVTNEDDCSAPPTSDLFDKSKTAEYGYLSSYRCTRHGMSCQGALPPYGASNGALAGCTAISGTSGGKEYDLSRYIDFFTRPAVAGGVKENPLDVLLIGVTPPSEPVETILSNPGTAGGAPLPSCSPLNETSNPPCVPVVQRSCQNMAQPVFFGDPAVRLNTVIRSAKNHQLSSICDGDYSAALMSLGNVFVSNVSGGCIVARLTDPAHPDCVVDDVTYNADGTISVTTLRSCAASGGAAPCWKLEPRVACSTISPDGLGVTIERGDIAVPRNTDSRVACATVPGAAGGGF